MIVQELAAALPGCLGKLGLPLLAVLRILSRDPVELDLVYPPPVLKGLLAIAGLGDIGDQGGQGEQRWTGARDLPEANARGLGVVWRIVVALLSASPKS